MNFLQQFQTQAIAGSATGEVKTDDCEQLSLMAFKKGMSRISNYALKKLAVKIFSRYASYIGVSIMLYNFGDCMGCF